MRPVPRPRPSSAPGPPRVITVGDIRDAHLRIRPHLRDTPVVELGGRALGLEHPVVLKLEQLQHSGSFKVRGALNALLGQPIPEAGVVAASGGNHGAAIAYAAGVLGVPARIFLPEFTPATKMERIRAFGASTRVVGSQFLQTVAAAEEHARTSGALAVHAYDQPETVAGQGSLGLELERQVPDLDVLLVAVGGGGLLAGILAWFEGRVKVVAVESEGTATLASALRSGPETAITVSGIAASALGAQRIGAIAFELAGRWLHRSVVVPDAAIVEAQRRLWRAARLFAEPGGVTALAALTSGAYRPEPGERVGVLLCGANAEPDWFLRTD